MTDLNDFEDMLRDRRAYLSRQLGKLEASLEKEPPKDVEDRSVERENDEVIEGLGTAGLSELRQIDDALRRIELGNYGICERCEQPISNERLRAVPHARICRGCMPPA